MRTSKYLAEIENTYHLIETNFDALFSRCQVDEEKDELISARNGAKNALRIAEKGNFPEDSSAINPVFKSLQHANRKIIKTIQDSENIETAVCAIEEAIRLAAIVAAMGD